MLRVNLFVGIAHPTFLRAVGYFPPTHQPPAEADLDGLKRAAAKLDAILEEAGINEDTLLTEFRQFREQK